MTLENKVVSSPIPSPVEGAPLLKAKQSTKLSFKLFDYNSKEKNLWSTASSATQSPSAWKIAATAVEVSRPTVQAYMVPAPHSMDLITVEKPKEPTFNKDMVRK